ncbi:hypothetical protein L1887_61924 [Cichorium endivia]|nr:hypothetical protein L1887_61924 [Cichorium endivia]
MRRMRPTSSRRGVRVGRGLLRIHKRLSATDISAHASMKNVAKCDTWCELQNPVNHRVFERKLRPKPSGPRARLPGRHASRRPQPCIPYRDTWHRGGDWVSRAYGAVGLNWSPLRVLEIVGREANGGRRCVPVGCGTAIAGPPIDSGRGPVRIGAAAKARAVDRLVEMPSRRSWLAARAVSAIYLRAPGTGLWAPHSARLETHGPRSLTCVRVNGGERLIEPSSSWFPSEVSLRIAGARVRDGAAASLSRATESRAPSGPLLVKQNWRCGMNRKPGYGAKLRANLEPTKGVGRLRQQDGGHGSRNPLRSV